MKTDTLKHLFVSTEEAVETTEVETGKTSTQSVLSGHSTDG